MPLFKRVYKKPHLKEKVIVDEAIRMIVGDPKIGDKKKGDLARVYVYKFMMNAKKCSWLMSGMKSREFYWHLVCTKVFTVILRWSIINPEI